MAQQSARRGRKNQVYSSCLEHAFMIWSPVCELPYGPRSFIAASSEAGQMAASDYVPNFLKNRLHLAGRPQMSNARGLSWFVRDPPDLSVRPFGGSAPPAQFAIEGDVTVYWDAGCPTVGLPPSAEQAPHGLRCRRRILRQRKCSAISVPAAGCCGGTS